MLTDPTFDPPGGRYTLRLGHGVPQADRPGGRRRRPRPDRRRAAQPRPPRRQPRRPRAGRCCPAAGVVVTTTRRGPAARRRARGLVPWATTRLEAPGRPAIEVTATPCRHGPPLSRPIVGDVIGFALGWEGQEHGVLWISGDTVLYDGVREVADRLEVDLAVLHLGGVRFRLTGPIRYSMTAHEAVELCRPGPAPHRGPGPLRGLVPLPRGPRGGRAPELAADARQPAAGASAGCPSGPVSASPAEPIGLALLDSGR